MEDRGRKVTLPAIEKLQQLESSQHGWMHAKFDFERTIPIKHSTSGLYDLGGGMYFSGNESRTALHYCNLPDNRNDKPEWKCIKMGANRTIVDFALCINEHDLLVVLTKRPSTTALNLRTLEIQFFKLSTHAYHPEAKQPAITVYESSWNNFAAYIEVVGKNLFLVVHHVGDRSVPADRLTVYDWKTGKLKMSVSSLYCSLTGIVPLAEAKILIFNPYFLAFDLWRVSDTVEDQPTLPERSLELPSLHDKWDVRMASCRGEPNPTSKLSSLTKPYDSNPDSALVILILSLRSGENMSDFCFVTKRHTLLEFYPYEPAPKTIAPSLVDVEVKDEFDLYMQGEGRRSVTWNSWGQTNSRIIRLSPRKMSWITVSAGERLVTMHPGSEGKPQSVEIYDFNPLRIKQTQAHLKENPSDHPKIRVADGLSKFQAGTGFTVDAESSLPFSVVTVTDFPQFDRLLMDEHRLLGFRGDEKDKEGRIHVFHMGRPREEKIESRLRSLFSDKRVG